MPVFGFSQTCNYTQEISYADGTKGCLTDLPLSRIIDKSLGKSITNVVGSAPRYYSIASSSICNVTTIGSVFRKEFNALDRLETEKIALKNCPDKCECSVVIDNGKVLLPKKLAVLIGTDEINFAEKTKINQTLPELESIKQAELEKQKLVGEQHKRELEAQLQKQTDLDIARQREIELQRFAEAQKIKDSQVRQKAEAESKERQRLLELAAEEENKKTQEVERQKQKALAAQQEIDKNLVFAKVEQSERQRDRELLEQLSAELAKLRAEAEAAKKAQLSPNRIGFVTSSGKSEVVPVAAQVFANRKALIIGNDGYKYVPKLLNAKQDATSIAENLTKVGYNVTLRLDQSEKEMKATLRSFKAQVDSGDEVAIFYAGHGIQLANTNYLIPIDVAGEGEEQIRDEAISLQRILDDMSDKKVKFTLAMIDACRDNPFKGSGRSIGGGARGLAPTTAATGQMVVFSAGTGQQALDKLGPNDKDKNGLFTRVFIKEMQKSGVTIDQLVRIVRNEVVTTAKSIGHDQVPAIYDQVVGEFYFRK